jgi:AraC family transcriptional regulator of adaptative response/methylated-DNA-[protein]-cysteine methyltransferase
MLAIADASDLLLLEFSGRRGLQSAVTRLAATGPLAAGRSAPIDSIERELAAYFAGRSSQFLTPFRLDGTPFQVGVWRRLLQIPPGDTISYLQLATDVGKPRAFRAVAQANGANRLAVIVPCHRVINTNGQLGGYGGGVPRKNWLLQHERQRFGVGAGRLF